MTCRPDIYKLSFHKREILPYFNKVLKSHFKLNDKIYEIGYDCSGDDLRWLEKIFINPPKYDELLKIIMKYFSHIELYHACSPEKLMPYYEKGIQLLDMSKVEGDFKKIRLS